MLLLLLLLLCLPTVVTNRACGDFIDFLFSANHTVGNALTKRALTGAQREDVKTGTVKFCSQDQMGCCDEYSEQVLRHTAGDAFLSLTFQLLDRHRTALVELENRLWSEIEGQVQAADGRATADATIRYLEGRSSIEEIVLAKLGHFMQQMWTTSWRPRCFTALTRTRAETSLRVVRVVSQFAHLLQSVREGLALLDKIREFGMESQSQECRNSLVKAGLYEGAGCQMCNPQIGKAVPVCTEYCLNVAKGCLRPLLCYKEEWDRWIAHQTTMVRELISVSRSRASFTDRLKKVFDAEFHEKSGQPTLELAECTPPERDRSDASEYRLLPLAPPTLRQSPDLFARHFAGMLLELPGLLCKHVQGGASPTNEACWNGKALTGYTSPSTLFNLRDQLCNPEVFPERLFCDLRPSELEMTCDRERYLMTDYAVTPTDTTPGRGTGAADRVTVVASVVALVAILWVVLLDI